MIFPVASLMGVATGFLLASSWIVVSVWVRMHFTISARLLLQCSIEALTMLSIHSSKSPLEKSVSNSCPRMILIGDSKLLVLCTCVLSCVLLLLPPEVWKFAETNGEHVLLLLPYDSYVKTMVNAMMVLSVAGR